MKITAKLWKKYLNFLHKNKSSYQVTSEVISFFFSLSCSSIGVPLSLYDYGQVIIIRTESKEAETSWNPCILMLLLCIYVYLSTNTLILIFFAADGDIWKEIKVELPTKFGHQISIMHASFVCMCVYACHKYQTMILKESE